jgi:hypothetical protein
LSTLFDVFDHTCVQNVPRPPHTGCAPQLDSDTYAQCAHHCGVDDPACSARCVKSYYDSTRSSLGTYLMVNSNPFDLPQPSGIGEYMQLNGEPLPHVMQVVQAQR